jgi:CRISPR-associated protein (TIGR02584 family)
MNPESSQSRRILICVTGLSPQIVTETIYALCVVQTPRWVPDEIQLITTERGAVNARLMLLSESPGWFRRLRQDWNLPPIQFNESNIHVLRDASGQALDDIRDDEDNQSAANGIADWVRRVTADDRTEVHASIAGGRKTMGFFMGYAMSLWGRPQDRLSHVLVSTPFEARPEFFYPTPEPCVIPARNPGQDPLDASTAKVWLGDIPFVRLRSLLPIGMREQNIGFAQAVFAANRALDQLELEVDLPKGCIRINQQAIALPPMQLALLCVLAWRCKAQLPPLPAPSKEVDDPEWKQQVRQSLKQVMGEMQIPVTLDQKLSGREAIGDTFSQQLSKMERTLRQSGTVPLRGLIERVNISTRGRQQGYRLQLAPQQIRILTATGSASLLKPKS